MNPMELKALLESILKELKELNEAVREKKNTPVKKPGRPVKKATE